MKRILICLALLGLVGCAAEVPSKGKCPASCPSCPDCPKDACKDCHK